MVCIALFCGSISLACLVCMFKMLSAVNNLEIAFRDCVTELTTCRGCVRENKKH